MSFVNVLPVLLTGGLICRNTSNHMFQQVQGFCLVHDALMNLLSRDEVNPRSNLSLSLAGTTLDPLAEIQSLKGLKPGAVLRLVEGNRHCFFFFFLNLFVGVFEHHHLSFLKD